MYEKKIKKLEENEMSYYNYFIELILWVSTLFCSHFPDNFITLIASDCFRIRYFITVRNINDQSFN